MVKEKQVIKSKSVNQTSDEQNSVEKIEVKKSAESIPIDSDKKKKLIEVMNSINRTFKKDGMIKFAVNEPPKECIPFGIPLIDEFLGNGAVKGNFIVIYGGEGVGKTTLGLNLIAECQKNGGTAAFIDLEHTLDNNRMIKFGVNLDQLVLVEGCTTAEEAMDVTIKLSKEQVVDLIVIDSIQAMSPKEEQFEGKGGKERSMDASEMALLARRLSKFLRRTAPFIYAGKVAVMLIGQVRTGGLGGFIVKEELSAGHAVKHWSLLTVSMRKGQSVDAPSEKKVLDTFKKDDEGNIKLDKKTGKPIHEIKEVKLGFDAVLKIEKTKKSGSKPELSELHVPYYFDSGFFKGDKK